MSALLTGSLLTGIAAHLSASGCLVVNGQTPFLAYRIVPPDPDFLLCFTNYSIDDDVNQGHSTISVQLWARSPQSLYSYADDLLDACFYQLQNLPGQTLPGGAIVATVGRTSTMPLGLDSRGRLERSDNYDAITVAPLVNRP